jgi:hypothetical protein
VAQPARAASPPRWRAAASRVMVAVCLRPPSVAALVGKRRTMRPLSTRLTNSTIAPALPSTRHTSSLWPAPGPARRPPSPLRSDAPRLRWTRSRAQWTPCAGRSSGSPDPRDPLRLRDATSMPSSFTTASPSPATRSARRVARSARSARQWGPRRPIRDEPVPADIAASGPGPPAVEYRLVDRRGRPASTSSSSPDSSPRPWCATHPIPRRCATGADWDRYLAGRPGRRDSAAEPARALERLGFHAAVSGDLVRVSGCPCAVVSPDHPAVLCAPWRPDWSRASSRPAGATSAWPTTPATPSSGGAPCA